MQLTKRRLMLFLSIFALLLIGYFVIRGVMAARNAVPADFQEARSRGAVISQDIVNISNEINEEIVQINDLEKAKKYKEALAAVSSLEQDAQEVRDRAADLSKELKIMAENLESLSPEEARQEALDSISYRLDLLNHLITYTEQLNQLSATLTRRLQNRNTPVGNIPLLVSQINEEIKAINNFNSLAGQAMDRFDAVVR
jgi:uncharacterized phage infection (PIP) family protein YhgE